jgi:hypothetical protein
MQDLQAIDDILNDAELEPQRAPARIDLSCPEEMSKEAALAMHMLRPTLQGAITAHAWAKKAGLANDELSINALADELTKQVNAVIKSNDLGRCEALLVVQAHILDTVSNTLLGRAARAEYTEQLEVNMRLGLKAQAQCRATVEALASVRSPVVLKQTNIAHGPQQVNTEINAEAQSKLSAGSSNAPLETVGTINGAENSGREIPCQSEQRKARANYCARPG